MKTQEKPLAVTLPLVENPTLLKVTTIKAKYVEQMEELGKCYDGSGVIPEKYRLDGAEIVGKTTVAYRLIVVKDGRYYKVGWLYFMDWLRQKHGKSLEEAQAEFGSLPQIFTD